MQHRRPEERPTRILAPITILAIVILSGALAMYEVGRGRWSLAESFFYVTLSARSLDVAARIVSKVIAPDAAPKMIRAGANATVSPNMIGGRRLASELVRPTESDSRRGHAEKSIGIEQRAPGG